jgi:hypothetical protein
MRPAALPAATPAGLDLDAGDRAHERRLAAAAGAKEPGDDAGRDLEGKVADHLALAAPDVQVCDPDCRRHVGASVGRRGIPRRPTWSRYRVTTAARSMAFSDTTTIIEARPAAA